MSEVVETCVGYTGGEKEDPTYRSLGRHTEAIRITYKKDAITYRDLLELFWKSHSPTQSSWSRQYMNAIFCLTDEQEAAARETKKALEEELGATVQTRIVRVDRFTPAENYHQKYYLRQNAAVLKAFRGVLKEDPGLIHSTAAARANGLLRGKGTWKELARAARAEGVDVDRLKKHLKPSDEPGCR